MAIPCSVREAYHAQAVEEPRLEAPVVARCVGQHQVTHAVLLPFVVPVPHILRPVFILVAPVLDHAGTRLWHTQTDTDTH